MHFLHIAAQHGEHFQCFFRGDQVFGAAITFLVESHQHVFLPQPSDALVQSGG